MEDKTASQRNHLTSLFSPTNLIKPFKVEYLVPKLRSVQTFENETFRVYKKVSEYFLSHFLDSGRMLLFLLHLDHLLDVHFDLQLHQVKAGQRVLG